MPYTHVVRFSEVDGAGIVFFSRVFEVAHAAYEAWLSDGGLGLAAVISAADWVLPLVHAEADYHAPMRLGDRVEVTVAVERVGDSSVTWRFDLASPDGRALATVRHVHVAVDRQTFRPRGLPGEIRALVTPPAP